jgi:hypothetical protein
MPTLARAGRAARPFNSSREMVSYLRVVMYALLGCAALYLCCGFPANAGGGISNSGTVTLRSSIIANGTANFDGQDLYGTFNSEGYNLIEDTSSTGINETANAGTNITGQDPNLGPLAYNGGPTQTHALLSGSPAIDKGKNFSGSSTDQRGAGFNRIVNATVDVGAVEINYAISATAGTPQSAVINTPFPTQLQAAVTESGNALGGIPVTFTPPASGAGGTFSASATVNTNGSGVATAPAFTANGTAGGPYNVVAAIGAGLPAANFALTNLKANQTITFGALANETFGDADFSVSAASTSRLPVSFAASGNCSVTGSTVHLTGAGSCTVTASQAGDGNYNAAASVQQPFSISKAATVTAVSSSANPSNSGQGVTFTAAVTSSAGTPAGAVTFKDGGSAIPSCADVALSSGQAACTTSALSVGGHTVMADYSGDSDFAASTGTLPGGQAVNGGFEFSQATYTVSERGGSIVIAVRRTDDTSQAASVDYATDDGSTPSVAVACSSITGIALERCDYTRAAGTLNFAAGDTQKTFTVLVNDDSYAEGTETLSLRLSNPVGAALGPQSSASLQITNDMPESTGNPVDDDGAFVRQHYRDFLNREPDAPGLQFWTDNIRSCGSDAQCRAVKRVDTSAAFFLSIEFQNTGFFAYRVFKAAFGDAVGASSLGGSHQLSVPVVRLQKFLSDTQAIGQGVVVGQGDWEQRLTNDKAAFALAFVGRPDFRARYIGATSAAAFVNSLNTNTGGVLNDDERSALISELSPNPADAGLRADVLRKVAENPRFTAAEFNRAFVLMQYFGYLRRNPDDAPERTLDYTGYDFWLSKLNQFNGNYVQAEMVRAFIEATEYRGRFGQ